jgi:hypothetical protein
MKEQTLGEKLQENQAFEKFGFLTASQLLTVTGVGLLSAGKDLVGIVLVVLGVGCLALREYWKVKE